MDETCYARAKEIFLDACERPADERRTYVTETCGTDDALRSMVLRMLDVDSSEEEFMATPVGSPELLEVDGAPVEIPGYELRHKLGKGGMGEVWLAEQIEPVRRQVAVKIIKRGMDSEQVVARFEAERQALALMNHHHVARVFDAGTTADGRPFFAMEYVEGVPITEHCDRHRLSTRQRLELVQQVCSGVQHAHQKGIIHRDLKPSNVLVQVEGGEAVPKIIDFGIAKATQQRLTEQTIETQVGLMIGTPEYMSPEQAEMTTEDVDTRTDVYSLGVLLYELLVGALPFDSKELRLAGLDEIRRRIREQDPSRPSLRISTLGEHSTATAQRRRTDVSTLRRQLRGDLDWIVMKALEKDRSRRYDSPSGLAADLGRHLSHDPVQARPPSAAYQARKFVRRHRVGVSVAGVLLTVLIAFAVMTTLQYRRIAVEARTAEEVVSFLTGLFQVSNPSEARGNTITVREILDRGAREVEAGLEAQPLVQARLMDTMGTVYLTLGLHDPAESLLERAVELRRGLHGDTDSRTLNSKNSLASLYQHQGRYEESELLLGENLELLREQVGEDDPDRLRTTTNLARVYLSQGRFEEAEELYLETLAIEERTLGEGHPGTAATRNGLAGVYEGQERYDEAEPLHRFNLEIRRRALGEDHPLTLETMANLAGVSGNLGRFEEAEALFLETLEIEARVLGEDHVNTVRTGNNLAILYSELGRFDEAEELLLDGLDILRREVGGDYPLAIAIRGNLSLLYLRQRRFEEAEPLIREALEANRRVLGADHPDTLWCLTVLGVACDELDQDEEAGALFEEAVEAEIRVLGEGHPKTLSSMVNLASFLVAHDEEEAAFEYVERAVELGFDSADWLANAPRLQALHGPEFDALVEKARENAGGE